jgi:hypothetical protein
MDDQAKLLHRQQMAQFYAACSIQAGKREKKPLQESPSEMYERISEQKDAKKIKRAKSAAKASLKKKKMKTMAFYFGEK